ncbi:MAG TPA: hypothetical protein VHT05_14925 [Candidatus Elarobacter sp.]|nr:hypothetical protein [Candidatus Elarobacter sp.]
MLAAPADAQAPPAAGAPGSPVPSPSASPKPPGAAAAAIAASMRRFDPQLTDADLDTIARGIDENRRGEARLNPHRATGLHNADEPVTRFAVRDER